MSEKDALKPLSTAVRELSEGRIHILPDSPEDLEAEDLILDDPVLEDGLLLGDEPADEEEDAAQDDEDGAQEEEEDSGSGDEEAPETEAED